MNIDSHIADENYRQISLANQRWGVIFGLVLGLAFAAGAWGVDALALSQTSTQYPWLRLVPGLLLSLPFALLAGWIAARSENGLVSAIVWAVAAAISLWIAGHIPYEISSQIVRWLDPNFRGLEVYPFPESAATRLGMGIAVGIVLAIIAGGLGTMAVDNLRLGVGFTRIGMTVICCGLMICAGLFSDNINNRPLRAPLVEMEHLIELYKSYQGKSITPQESRQLHFGVVKPMADMIDQPRQMVLGDYQPDTLESARVFVRLGDTWFRCWVIVEQPSFCQKSDEVYANAFTCLWQGGDKCGALLKGDTSAWIKQNDQDKIVSTHVFTQRGAYTLLDVDLGQQGRVECRFKDSGSLSIESCYALPSLVANNGESPEKAQPTDTATSEPEENTSWQKAVLPEDWSAVNKLQGLPHYSMQVELAPDGHSFSGQMTLDYTNTETVRLDELVLRLIPNDDKSYGNGSLKISSPVTIAGQEVRAGEQADDPSVFRIPLAGGLEPGAATRVELKFNGVVPVDFGGEDTAAYGLYNFTKNTLTLANWYPILAVYDDQGWRTDSTSAIGDSVYSEVAFFNVTITAPFNWVVAATGVQVAEEQDGTKTRHEYASGPERDFFIAASPDFKSLSKQVSGTVVNAYALAGSELGNEYALQVGAKAVEIYNSQFGTYPDTELDIVEAPMRNAGGVEFPGIVLIEAGRYEDPQSNTFITTVAHEVAHQWWYNVVGDDIFTDPWLDEGLATYSSFVYFDVAQGSEAYQGILDYYRQRYDKLVQSGNDDRVTNSLSYFEKEHPERYGSVVYAKAALFFDAVRQEIGDQAFFAGLQDYYQREMYKVAMPEDLLSAFERAAGRQLDDLYQKWLYEPKP